MYQPSTACVDNEGRLEAALWTKNLVPGGAMGVSLKPKLPLMAVWAESIGFVQEERIGLRVSTDWGMKRSHSWEGKLGLQEASPSQRCFLNVKITRSAALWRWVYGEQVGSQCCTCERLSA